MGTLSPVTTGRSQASASSSTDIVNPSSELVNRLWRLCAVLRKDGITYPQYVAELTYLLFLKMMQETGSEERRVPVGLRWADLTEVPSARKLDVYRNILAGLGDPARGTDPAIVAIFHSAATVLRDTKNLEMLIEAIGKIEWFSTGRDSFGDLYEGLLQKNAEETKRGAGQYFTPRAVIETIVQLMKPQPGEVIQDPAAGTGGFLISAHRYAESSPANDGVGPIRITGMENVGETYRLLLMNLYLHGIEAADVHLGDTLSPDHERLVTPDVILTNPPFGPAGGRPARADLAITGTVATYQLPFVEHCIRGLRFGGRAAIVVPDNVLSDDGRGRLLRQLLLDECDLHTILRLPPGIFYAQGIRTNVIFFRKGGGVDGTKAVWIYDLRTGMPAFGRSQSLRPEHFEAFIAAYGSDPNGTSARSDEGVAGRFRRFDREEIRGREDNLDITWLRDDEESDLESDLAEPEELTVAIAAHLRSALAELESIAEEIELDALDDLAQLPVE